MFGEFYKCPGYLFKWAKQKNRNNKKKKAEATYLAPQARPTSPWPGPAHPRACRLLRRREAARWRPERAPAPPRRHEPSRPPPHLSLRHGGPLTRRILLLPSL